MDVLIIKNMKKAFFLEFDFIRVHHFPDATILTNLICNCVLSQLPLSILRKIVNENRGFSLFFWFLFIYFALPLITMTEVTYPLP